MGIHQIKSRGRIAIFYPYRYLGTFPNLCDAAKLLAEDGYLVEIYTIRDKSFPSPDFEDPAISIITNRSGVFEKAGLEWPYLNIGQIYGWGWLARNVYRPLWRRLIFKRILRQLHTSKAYTCLVGMDPEGLAAAAAFSDFLGVPYVYWSLELLLLSEIRENKLRTEKLWEIKHSRRAVFTITHDKWRGKALIDENRLDPAKVLCVANAPSGRARRSPSNFLRERLNIPSQRKIVLCAGWMACWAMSEEIMAAAASWPEEYVLVWQSRHELDKSSLKSVDSKKVIILSKPVSSRQYRDLVDSADVGLAFYGLPPVDSPYRRNIELMGFSSGKIADYLQCGLPIVVNDRIGPRDLVDSYECGVCVAQPSEIEGALRTIFDRYDWYVSNACRCFEDCLELEKNFLPVTERLRSL